MSPVERPVSCWPLKTIIDLSTEQSELDNFFVGEMLAEVHIDFVAVDRVLTLVCTENLNPNILVMKSAKDRT